ncbi:hypothetical protein ES703_23330 [subsurface metagenome]
MAEVEVMELINAKREDLERRRSQETVSSSLLKVLEDEIKELEASLSEPDSSEEPEEQTFLDECAG